MTAFQRLTKRLQEMPDGDREEMAEALLEEMDSRAWDQEIEGDARNGILDKKIAEAKQDHRAGRTTPLRG